jgi:pepF/M3 family oligoendopeptidase
MTDMTPPRWDLTGIFPSPISGEYIAAVVNLRANMEQMQQLFDEYGIGLDSGAHPDTDAGKIISTWNEAGDLADLLDNYLYCWTSTDSNDAAAASAYGEFDMITSPMKALRSRLTTWMGTLRSDALTDPVAKDHRYQVEQARIGAQHVMAPELEDLAGALQATGGQAWVRARDESNAGLTASITIDGETQTKSLTELEALLSSPDREKRRIAAEAMDTAHEKAAPAFAASLNAIKGEALTLAKRRQWHSPLDWSLYVSAIDQDILEAMFAAAESVHGELHKYMQTKARLLGIEQMAHYDLSAPISTTAREVTWPDAEKTVRDVLSPFSERLARVVDSALTSHWVDAEPREGKVSGGYCASLRPYGSRILLNFVPSFDTTQTLAHELGHAHHNDCLAERSNLQCETPMTLAETASMFCQRMVEDKVLAEATPEVQLVALDQILQNSVGTLLDLHARFHFEKDVFERRTNRTISVDELTKLMAEKQRVAYGPGLAADQVHAWQWVQKPHYYDTDFHYYNYPYQFGLLFALGLLKIYRDQPDGFPERYERLLSRTGMANAYDLAKEFGIDVRDRAFWDGSVAVIRDDVAQFEQVAAQSTR